MKILFDPVKSAKNARERGLPFDLAEEFDWGTAIFDEDSRKAYPERRFIAIGYLEARLHFICFTPMGGDVRIISFRKADKKEVRDYEQKTLHG